MFAFALHSVFLAAAVSQQYSARRLHCLGGTKVVCRLGHEIASEMAIS